MKGILTFLLLTFSILSIAQSKTIKDNNIDNRLYEVYDKDYLTSLQKGNPFLLERWSFYLDNSYFITTYPSEKGAPNYPSVEIDNLKDFNILLIEKNQRLTRNFDKQTVYQIKGTDQVLVYYSGKMFNQKLNKHLGRK